MTDSKQFRTGLVGTGQISEFHIQALRRLKNVILAGVTDLDQNRAKAVADRFHLAGVYPTMDALIDAGVDVIHVLTPPSSHADLTVQAIRRALAQ